MDPLSVAVVVALVVGVVALVGKVLKDRNVKKEKKAGLPRKERLERKPPVAVELVELEEDNDVYLLTKINARLEKLSDLNQRYAKLREPIQSKLTLISPV